MTPLEIEIKGYMRDFFRERMEESKRKHGVKSVPAIIIREVEMENWIDELWVSMNQRKLKDQNAKKE